MKTKKNKNGGMVQKFPTCLKKYNALNHPNRSDCGANCFFLLNYSDSDTSMYLAEKTLTGIYLFDMLDIYNKSYEDSAEWINITRFNVDEIEKVLPSTYATIIYVHLTYPTFTPHYVVLLNNNGTFVVLDPQNCKGINFDDYRKFRQIKVVFILKSKPTKDKNKVTKEIIDEVLDKENESNPTDKNREIIDEVLDKGNESKPDEVLGQENELYETKSMSQEYNSSNKRSRYSEDESEDGSNKRR